MGGHGAFPNPSLLQEHVSSLPTPDGRQLTVIVTTRETTNLAVDKYRTYERVRTEFWLDGKQLTRDEAKAAMGYEQ